MLHIIEPVIVYDRDAEISDANFEVIPTSMSSEHVWKMDFTDSLFISSPFGAVTFFCYIRLYFVLFKTFYSKPSRMFVQGFALVGIFIY